ncbi:MAG: TldD/PmbA family protein [Candidatus Methanomethylophilaceae archaeon]|nr:TldD/PmbA family protein [Candidatus Methanomethylophilaceae archaeon]
MIYPDERAIRALDKYDQAEVYVSEAVVNTVYIDGSKISNIETKKESGMMFRMIHGSRTGKASVSLCSPDSAADCLEMADSVLKYSPVNPDSGSYPCPGQAGIPAPDVWDKKAENIAPEDLRELAEQLIGECRVNIPRAQIRVSAMNSRTVNSNGVDTGHRSTLVYGHFTSMANIDHPGEGTETFYGTHLDLDPVCIAHSLSRKAEAAAGSREFRGTSGVTMILPPGELGDMLLSSVGSAVNGENVKYGRTLWKDSLGGKVASESLCIADDPASKAPLSCVFDDEGTPAGRHTIIEKGILRGFLRDAFCGDSTGNGMRRSSVEPQGAYDRTPAVKPLNMTVKPGNLTRDQIIENTDNGILVEKFAWPEADGLTGRFGLNVRCGYLVRKGEITGVISNALLMGNMLEALNEIECIGSDSTCRGVVTVPTMSFSGAELAGN